MSNTNTGGPAFPAPTTKPLENYYPGISVRDYFAAKAMQGFLMDDALHKEASTAKEWLKSIADASYEMADAMLKAQGEKK